jgi:hypothetical protein
MRVVDDDDMQTFLPGMMWRGVVMMRASWSAAPEIAKKGDGPDAAGVRTVDRAAGIQTSPA